MLRTWNAPDLINPLNETSSLHYVKRYTILIFSWTDSKSPLHLDQCVTSFGQVGFLEPNMLSMCKTHFAWIFVLIKVPLKIPWRILAVRRMRSTSATTLWGAAPTFIGDLILDPELKRDLALRVKPFWLTSNLNSLISKEFFAAMQQAVISYNRTTFSRSSERTRPRMPGEKTTWSQLMKVFFASAHAPWNRAAGTGCTAKARQQASQVS